MFMRFFCTQCIQLLYRMSQKYAVNWGGGGDTVQNNEQSLHKNEFGNDGVTYYSHSKVFPATVEQ
jgi:hypothetical protein